MQMPTSLDKGDTRLLITTASKFNALRNQTAYILSTGWIETAFTMKPVEEAYYLQQRYGWSDERMDKWRRDNLRYYPWHGRGYVQMTWEDNYKRADRELYLDGQLLRKPDLAMDPAISSQVTVLGMQRGWFTGKKLSDYITLQKSDFYNARRIVNGTDRQQDFADVARVYDKLLLAEGYGVEDAPKEQSLEDRVAELEARVDKLERGFLA